MGVQAVTDREPDVGRSKLQLAAPNIRVFIDSDSILYWASKKLLAVD